MEKPSLERIIAARDRCAQIIALCGEAYLPIFERLEEEIATREYHEELLRKALKIATQNGTHLKTEFLRVCN